DAIRGEAGAFDPREKSGEQFLAGANRRHLDELCSWIDLDVLVSESAGGVVDRHHRTAERPATAECEIESQPPFAGLLTGEAQGLDELIREKRQDPDSLLRILQHQGIDGLHLKAPDAAFLHHAQLPLELRLGYRGSKPPPAHHDARVVGRVYE